MSVRMTIDVAKESLCINRILGQKSQTIIVEGDVIVPDIKPDILSAIQTTGNVCVYKKEIMEGKIRIDGDVKLYVMYLADDEESAIRSLNSSVDFTQVVDFEGCLPQMSIDDDICIRNIECQVLNGRKINIKATLDLNVKIYSNENVELINKVNNLDDVQMLKSEQEIDSLVGEGITKSTAKDTIVIDSEEKIAEILSAKCNVINKEVKISYNKVLAKAEIETKIIYLTQENSIKVKLEKIPLMGFIDIENISETNICDLKYKLKNMLIKANTNSDNSIYIEAEYELYCRVYEKQKIEIIQDMYCPNANLEFKSKHVTTMSNKNNIIEKCSISEKFNVPELNTNQLYNAELQPRIISKNVSNSRITYEGEIDILFLFSGNNSARIDEKKYTMPFNFNIIADNINENTNIDTMIEIANQDIIIGNDGNVELRTELIFNINTANNTQINIIDEMQTTPMDTKDCYSMVIHFVKEKDTLWKIAKMHKSTIEDIVKTNNIEDPNKIFVGQQLFIPKYVHTQI